jgi:hypothetical protein
MAAAPGPRRTSTALTSTALTLTVAAVPAAPVRGDRAAR